MKRANKKSELSDNLHHLKKFMDDVVRKGVTVERWNDARETAKTPSPPPLSGDWTQADTSKLSTYTLIPVDMEHTQGPWTWEREEDMVTISDRHHLPVCIIPPTYAFTLHDEMDANAVLISEAPQMYETLLEIREWYEKNHERYMGTDTPVCFSKALSRILAIEKATS